MRSLPEWLIGDSNDRTFVIHLHPPRFVAEVEEDGDSDLIYPVMWIDPPELDELKLAALMRAAGEFYEEEADRE